MSLIGDCSAQSGARQPLLHNPPKDIHKLPPTTAAMEYRLSSDARTHVRLLRKEVSDTEVDIMTEEAAPGLSSDDEQEGGLQAAPPLRHLTAIIEVELKPDHAECAPPYPNPLASPYDLHSHPAQ